MGASVAMVFVFQPILASYMPRPEVRESGLLNRLRNSGMIAGLRSFVSGNRDGRLLPMELRGPCLSRSAH